jgi:hypothetical protein
MRALVIVLAALSAATASAQTLEVSNSPNDFSCPLVRGHFVAFSSPGNGMVLLASQPFPGGSPVGSVENGRLEVSVPGYGEVPASVEGAISGSPIWGMLDRTLDLGQKRACLGLEERRFSDVNDLKTYFRWFFEHVLDRIDLHPGEPAPAIWLEDRKVTLELLTPDHRTLRVRGDEGATLGFQPHESEHKIFFQPFVLGDGGDGIVVSVSTKTGDFFGPGTAEEIAFVRLSSETPETIPTEPPVALRLVTIEPPISFDN